MNKLFFLFIIAFLLPFCLIGCQKEENLTSYHISAVYDEDEKTLSCLQNVNYFNSSENSLNEISFYLYPNSFKEIAVSDFYYEKAYFSGDSFGGVEIESVEVAGQEQEFHLEGEEILNIPLFSDLFPNEYIEISLSYTVSLADVNHRLGYGENAVNFGNFYPILCVYEDGFVKNSFSKNGDPFYSDIANYEVEITYPSAYTLASSGEVLEEKEENGEKKAKIVGERLRDFCFVLSTKFEKLSKSVNNMTVNYYFYDDENAEENLKFASSVMQEFSALFGKYPYKTINIVKTNFCYGGMEYPNLVYISDEIKDMETYHYVIAHELAHQWWYSVVGNNEFEEAWIDESLTEYSTALFFEKYGEINYDDIISGAYENYRLFMRTYSLVGEVDERMDRSLDEFETEPEYVNLVYTKGVMMFDSLRELLGENKFNKCLKEYFKEFSFKNVKRGDLIKSFSKTSHMNLEGFFNAWLQGEVVIEY